jgi:hypothetical protein
MVACSISLLGARAASATPEFPDAVASTWKVKAPDCTLCHGDDSLTVPKHVTTLVGRWFFGKGLTPYADSTLKTLLEESRKSSQDSDGDGISDYEELVDGTDPNERDVEAPPAVRADGGIGDAGPVVVVPSSDQPSSGQDQPPLLQTGCSLGIARGSYATPTSAVLALMVLSSLPRLRRRAAR